MSIHKKGNYRYYSDKSKCTRVQLWRYNTTMRWFIDVFIIKDNKIILQQTLIKPYTKKEFKDFVDKGGKNEK